MAIEKIARICWNTNNWHRPSGSEGKSKTKRSYEKEQGFGHEEWLFDERMILKDGYLYGYLQALLESKCHKGKVYDIHLFTINSDTGDRLYVGCLREAEVLTDEQRSWAEEECRKRGMQNLMSEDLRAVGIINRDVKVHPNVRFKIDQAELEYPMHHVIDKDHFSGWRYNLMDGGKERLNLCMEADAQVETRQSTDAITCSISSPVYIKEQRHKEMQIALEEYLRQNGYSDTDLEVVTPLGGRIDLRAYHIASKSWHYFEIKVYDARLSIREALGQLLEYAHYTLIPQDSKPSKLFIVGPEAPTDLDLKYLGRLRRNYKLPIHYAYFSFKDKRLYGEKETK